MINYRGLDRFSEEEIAVINELIKHHYKKFRHREIRNFDLIIHAKKHFSSGKKDKAIKYSINARIDAPQCIVVAKAFDWDIKKVCHEAMTKVEAEFNHKFKSDATISKAFYRR